MAQSEPTTMRHAATLDPLQIEGVLTDLWREYRAAEGTELAARARLANLISFCATNEEADEVSATVALLNVVRPVRSIIVVTEAGRAGEPEAGAALQCGITGENHVCYEEIVLHAPVDAALTIPSVVEPLTVADLPVYLWFPGDPPLDTPGIERLLSVADRVVTDSHTFRDPLRRFARLAELTARMRGQCVFTEMTWTRMGVWREAVGKLFDPMPSREFLPQVREVSIVSAHGDGEPSDRSIVMTGWLAARLGWQPTSLEHGSTTIARFRTETGPLSVSWAEGPPAAHGHLLSLDMKCGEVEFRVRRVQDDPAGAIRSSIMCSGDEQPGPAYHPQNWKPHELLCNALEIRTPFTDWEDALAVIGAVAAL